MLRACKRGVHVDREVGSRHRVRVPAGGVWALVVQLNSVHIAVGKLSTDCFRAYRRMRDLLPASRRLGGDAAAGVSVSNNRVPAVSAAELCDRN
jgi:hypothetical protein